MHVFEQAGGWHWGNTVPRVRGSGFKWARFHGWAKEKARTRLGSGVAHRFAKQVVSSVFAAASPSICELISARSKGSSIVVARCFASDKRSCRPRTTDLMAFSVCSRCTSSSARAEKA
ncbi:hypothetical protein C2L65_43085 [Paraburkholderia terrae]|uniref:Uncharacterized protein n=1 Tax=Paraburkholderia terrae TaxID=311230 RepID=A0A2I8F424_9BURK|nr:hypothetical protein C2L65_43085 [Paraburkholderia terrae]